MAGFGMNPAFDWRRFGGETLQDIGVGLTQSPTIWGGIGRAAQIGQEKQPYRDQQERIRKEDEAKQKAIVEQQEKRSKYADTFQAMGASPMLIDLVRNGDADPVETYWELATPKGQVDPTTTVSGRATLAEQYGLSGNEARDFILGGKLPSGGDGTEYGLTPQWFQMDDGSYGFGVVGKDGSFKPVETPEGATMLDPRSIATERAYGTKLGGAQGEAAAAAPGDIASANTALDIIGQIRTHPELKWATGTMAGYGGNSIPGTGRYDFQNLVDQAKSGAFLTAVQEMRGLGALSNAEGGAATQAITRMNTATSTEAFLKALEDYEKIVVNGLERAKARLNKDGPITPAGGGQGTVLTYNPLTGELE
jgi:hypothetical protein